MVMDVLQIVKLSLDLNAIVGRMDQMFALMFQVLMGN